MLSHSLWNFHRVKEQTFTWNISDMFWMMRVSVDRDNKDMAHNVHMKNVRDVCFWHPLFFLFSFYEGTRQTTPLIPSSGFPVSVYLGSVSKVYSIFSVEFAFIAIASALKVPEDWWDNSQSVVRIPITHRKAKKSCSLLNNVIS